MRRHLLRSRFGLRIPLHYSAGPVIAAALALAAAAATAYLLASAPALVVTAVALVAALLAYAAALKLWLILAGESLALRQIPHGLSAEGGGIGLRRFLIFPALHWGNTSA